VWKSYLIYYYNYKQFKFFENLLSSFLRRLRQKEKKGKVLLSVKMKKNIDKCNKNAPMKLGNAPTKLGNAPTKLGNAPTKLGNAPAKLGNAPTKLGKMRADKGGYYIARFII